MAMTELEQHYNKFNEEKRLDSRHGRVEFITSMKYIHNCLDDIKAAMDIASDIKILDIGAGTGRYSVFRNCWTVQNLILWWMPLIR